MTDEQRKAQKLEHDKIIAMPVVQAFTYYYDMQGSEMADGLLAGLIKYKEQLDRGGVPFQ